MASNESQEAASSPNSSPSTPPSPPSPTTPPPESPSSPSPPPPESPSSPSPPPPSSSKTPPPMESPPASSPPPPVNINASPPPPSDSSNQPPPPSKSSPSPPSGDNNRVPSPPPPSGAPNSPSSGVFSPPPPVDGSGTGSDGSSGSSSDSSDMSDHKAGIVLGVTVAGTLLLLMLIVCVVCGRRKRKRADYPYSQNNGPAPNGNQYRTNGPPGKDHTVNIPPAPGPLGAGPATGWTQSGQPPPNIMNNSGPFTGQAGGPLPPPSPGLALGLSKSMFTYEELAAATNGFAQSNVLGQGGFGFVHKGVLPNGKEVAVKSLKSGSGQGEREFQAEVEIISRVHHRHLVSLVGYCIAAGQRMLVYEFVPNNTLEYHLHKRGDLTLDFPTRLRIALGSAKGLAYLHEDCHPRIIHRDIKASNILIDHQFEAQVADFGLAKLTSDTNTHVSTRVMGTFGYLAPEYASSGKLTEKSDVFSF
ncbi:Proline-rich receptor-like protein [Drosera capensis]